MIEAWILRALLVVGLIGGFYWWADSNGYARSEKKHATELLAQKAAADQKEENWRADAATADEVHDEELARVNAQHLRDLERLRNRAPERLSATPKSCAGASPTALSAPDSAVVIGWGAEFDSLRAEYSKCVSAVERLRSPGEAP